MALGFIPLPVKSVMDALSPKEIRLVGGAVRAFVWKEPCPEDVDMATTMLPEDVATILTKKGYKVVPTGIKHGTVTVPLDAYTLEITTLRADVETDGRHARVVFSTDWEADSARRDFTMNALYLDREETLYDPQNGLADCQARQIRFVGEAVQRVQEDYLRILRYYRFASTYGLPKNIRDETQKLRPYYAGLPMLSAERVTTELFKTVQGPYAVDVLHFLKEEHILASLSLEPHRLEDLEIALHTYPKLSPLARWYIVFGQYQEHPHLVMSHSQQRSMAILHDAEMQFEHLGFFPLAAATSREAAIVAHALAGDVSAINFLQNADIPEFPLKGQDILDLGVPAGPKVGTLLANVKEWWLKNHLPDREACLQYLNQCVKF